MSRFTGPRLKVMRALGVDLPGLSRKTKESRPNPPGQHGARAVRRKKSDFGVQLIEKQKLRYNYGLQLNGRTASIPSMRLRAGDEVSMKPGRAELVVVVESLKEPALTRPEWLTWDEQQKRARIAHLPAVDDVPFPVDVQQVVEYYAKRL